MIHKKLRICPQPVISLVGNNGDVNNLVFSMDDQNEEKDGSLLSRKREIYVLNN
jgi:hypothetical protein